MYNDSWPATHTWAIVDYYLRKRPSFFTNKRAFAPVTSVIVDEGDSIMIYGINDNIQEWNGSLKFGIFYIRGENKTFHKKQVIIPANQSVVLATLDKTKWKKAGYTKSGVFSVLEKEKIPISQSRLFSKKFGDLTWIIPKINIERKGIYAVFTTNGFAWGVKIKTDDKELIIDNYFDLIPGVPYYIEWPVNKPLPEVEFVANENFN